MAFKRTRLNKSTTRTTNSNGKTSTSVRSNPYNVGSSQSSVSTRSDGTRVRTDTVRHGGGWVTRKSTTLWSPSMAKAKTSYAKSATVAQRAAALYAAPVLLPFSAGVVAVGYGLMHFPVMTALMVVGIGLTFLAAKWVASKAQ